MRELLDKSAFRISYSDFENISSKTGTWYTINGAFSKSVLEVELAAEVAQFLKDNPECKTVGGIDISCAADEHFCVRTQYYHCGLPTVE